MDAEEVDQAGSGAGEEEGMVGVRRGCRRSRRRGLGGWCGELQAVREVTIEARLRRSTGLIGPSGCGKSNLLRSLKRISERDASVRITGLPLEQRQRLRIARLLRLKPEISLLDEPCAALDAKATLAIEELLRRLVANYSIVIVTQSMAQARRNSQDCFFYAARRGGRARADGSDVSHPRNRRTGDCIEGRFG